MNAKDAPAVIMCVVCGDDYGTGSGGNYRGPGYNNCCSKECARAKYIADRMPLMVAPPPPFPTPYQPFRWEGNNNGTGSQPANRPPGTYTNPGKC